jgi:ppGpp synthetase/RelA/SpoT-type nucleotidyltranferase
MPAPLKVHAPRPATPVVSVVPDSSVGTGPVKEPGPAVAAPAVAGPAVAAPAVAAPAVAGNAAMNAAMGGSPPGAGPPGPAGPAMVAGQGLVGNQAVAASAGALPTAKKPRPGKKPAPKAPPVPRLAQKNTEDGPGKQKEAAGPRSPGVAASPRSPEVGLARPARLVLPSFTRRFDAPATLPPLRTASADRRPLASAARAFRNLVERARRAHDAQRSLLERLGRGAVDRHNRVDGRTRSRVGPGERDLDDLRDQALSTVDTAYEEGTAGLDLAVLRGRRLVGAASAGALRRVRANADTAGEQITTIVDDLASGYTGLLEQSAVAITTAAGQAVAAVQAYGAASATLFPGGRTPLVEAENEARRAAVPGLAAAAVTSLTKASDAQAQAYRDQIPVVGKQFSESELAKALTTRKEEIDTKGRAAVEKASRTAHGALGKQAASGHAALRRMAGDARESIKLRHRAARTRLVNEANALLQGAQAQARAELTGLETAAATGLPAFDRTITAVHDGLRPAAVSADSLSQSAEKAVEDTGPQVDQLGAAEQRLVTRADGSTGEAVAGAERAALLAAGQARVAAAGALRETGAGGARGMGDFVHGHDASFAATAKGVRQVADAWAMPLQRVFGDAVRKTKASMTAPFTEWKTTTEGKRNDYIGTVFTPYLTPATPLAGPVDEAADAIAKDLERRESGLEAAFDGWGTDEAAVSKALRGMTPTQGRALSWKYESDHGSLEAALGDELGGADLTSALAYLRGDQVAGAAAELDASTHWYNDEESRIEDIMRNLKPEELERLKGSKEGAEALAEVRDNLGGTDLKVFDALAAGNQNLADAFRMKDRIDDARKAGDIDAIHDVLIDYGKAATERGRAPATADQRRVAVQREFAGLTGAAGRAPATTITPQQAAAAVEKYALASIEVVTTGPEGTSTTETREITGANRALGVALIQGGENTVAARSARLGVETQRPGGPNLLKLDAALVDPRLKPGADITPKERQTALDERDQVFQKYAADYGGAKQAATAASAKTYLEGQLRAATGDDKDAGELAVRLAHEDYPTPKTAALAVKYASKGAGTDEELMFRFVERMDRDEIAAMRGEYQTLTGTALDDDLGTFGGQGWFTELSGDDRLRMERALLGVPRNDAERAEVAAFSMQQQRDETGWLGSWLAGDSLADQSLTSAQSRLTASLGGATVRVDDQGTPVWTDSAGRPVAPGSGMFDKDGKYTGADPREFASAVRVGKLAAENYAARIDSFANYLTTAVLVIGAVAAAVVTVATGGAASPLLIAAIAGLTGLGSMAVHSAVSGGRYGWEQAAVDLGMTAVQALTAGVGQHLSILARGGTQSLAAGMTTFRSAEGLANTMGGITGSTVGDLLVIGGATGGMSGFGGALLDEATWRKGFGPGLVTLLESTLTGALAGATSTVTSHAFESLPVGRAVGGTRPTLGDALSGSNAARAALRGTSSFLGGATGKGAELGLGKAFGTYHGDAGDILSEMGKAGLESAVQESAAGPLESAHRRPDRVEARAKLKRLREEWPELDRALKANPVARDSLLSHPDSVVLLDAALGDVRGRLAKAGIDDAVRRGEVTPEIQATVDSIVGDLKAEHPNEVLDRAAQVAIGKEIEAGTTKEGYRQQGFDLARREDPAYQRESVDRLRAEAPAAQKRLNRIVSDIAAETGGEASWRPGVKDRGRSLRKVAEYVEKFATGDASMLVDVVGARIRFDSVDKLYRALDALKSDPRLTIVRIKDRVTKSTPSGNRSVLMNVRLPDGHVAELKFSLKSYEAPSVTEHPLYEIRRDFESAAVLGGRSPTPVETLITAATEAYGRRDYGAAWHREMAGSRLRELLTEHPDVASIAARLVADSVLHPTNLAKSLADPRTRDATIEILRELADRRIIGARTLEEYRAAGPGRGPLFEPVDPAINREAGKDRKAVLVERAKQVDPARDVGATPNRAELARLADYATRLRENVHPAVDAEVRAFVERVAPGADVNVRTKDAAGILDKVRRMAQGSETRPGRPGYRAGDVIDAVGARITTDSMADLERVLEAAKAHFRTGNDGRILEIENMYAEPKDKNPAYRVIPLVVRIDVAGVPYTFELQLTTRRASIAADLEHNTLFKPYVELTEAETGRVAGMLAEAAALDQEETR